MMDCFERRLIGNQLGLLKAGGSIYLVPVGVRLQTNCFDAIHCGVASAFIEVYMEA